MTHMESGRVGARRSFANRRQTTLKLDGEHVFQMKQAESSWGKLGMCGLSQNAAELLWTFSLHVCVWRANRKIQTTMLNSQPLTTMITTALHRILCMTTEEKRETNILPIFANAD